MKNINLYGNLTHDVVYRTMKLKTGDSNSCISCYERNGGIVNIKRGIELQNPFDINVNMFNGKIAKACILEDGKPNNIRKTSIVDWGKQKINFKCVDGWNHISYLDKIDNKFECLNLKEIHSVDLCSSSYNKKQKQDILKLSKNINFLIISNQEINALGFKSIDILRNSLRCGLIIHSPTYILFYKGKETFYSSIKVKKHFKSVLGAGDYFVSVFIMSFLQNPNIKWALQQCIERTPNIILKANET